MSVVNYRKKILRGGYCSNPEIKLELQYVPSTVTIQPFLASSTWTAPAYTTSVEYLVVAGGGGSGATHDGGAAGGGGGGMVKTGLISVVPGTTYIIIVGLGGAGGIGLASPQTRETHGESGGNSEFNGIVALGGGGGYASRTNGSGGGGTLTTYPLSASTGGFGGSYNNGGGGGGGSLDNGVDGVIGGTRQGGAGGAGTLNIITGTAVNYGVGGRGGNSQTVYNAVAGLPNTGNGAFAPGTPFSSQRSGTPGGSGLVVLKYLV